MNEQQALSKMVPPGAKRPGKYREGVIQIWVTRSCDKACYACTQGSNLKGKSANITPEQFEIACLSLKDYFGVVGMFGGNPALHPQFEELCKILCKHIPYSRRGLWCNKLFGKGAIARKTFNPSISNLNVHMDKEAYAEFKRDWPESTVFGLESDSRHSPPFVALKDVEFNKDKRWDLISDCDINKHWSALIGVFRGELRAWFCEIAGAQSILHQNEPTYPDTGVQVVPGWWQKSMQDFAAQVRFHCHACGVPLRMYGELSQAENGVEKVSKTHAAIYKPKKADRPVEVISSPSVNTVSSFINYLGNAKK